MIATGCHAKSNYASHVQLFNAVNDTETNAYETAAPGTMVSYQVLGTHNLTGSNSKRFLGIHDDL